MIFGSHPLLSIFLPFPMRKQITNRHVQLSLLLNYCIFIWLFAVCWCCLLSLLSLHIWMPPRSLNSMNFSFIFPFTLHRRSFNTNFSTISWSFNFWFYLSSPSFLRLSLFHFISLSFSLTLCLFFYLLSLFCFHFYLRLFPLYVYALSHCACVDLFRLNGRCEKISCTNVWHVLCAHAFHYARICFKCHSSIIIHKWDEPIQLHFVLVYNNIC